MEVEKLLNNSFLSEVSKDFDIVEFEDVLENLFGLVCTLFRVGIYKAIALWSYEYVGESANGENVS